MFNQDRLQRNRYPLAGAIILILIGLVMMVRSQEMKQSNSYIETGRLALEIPMASFEPVMDENGNLYLLGDNESLMTEDMVNWESVDLDIDRQEKLLNKRQAVTDIPKLGQSDGVSMQATDLCIFENQGTYYLLTIQPLEAGQEVEVYKSIDLVGPYVGCVDAIQGRSVWQGYEALSLDPDYANPNDIDIYKDNSGQWILIVGDEDGYSFHPIFFTQDGWLVVSPFTSEVSIAIEDGGSDIAGDYYANETVTYTFTQDQMILASNQERIGTWNISDSESSWLSFTVDGTDYEGVSKITKDEAGNQVRLLMGTAEDGSLLTLVSYVQDKS